MSPEQKQTNDQLVILGVVIATATALSEIGINLQYRSVWDTVIVFPFGWVIADFMISLFGEVKARGKSRIFHSHFRVPRIAGAFVAYFIGILFASWASEPLSKILLALIALGVHDSADADKGFVAVSSFMAAILVYFDLYFRYDNRPKRRQPQKPTELG